MTLLAIGGAHLDRRGQVSGEYVPAASNPGVMREDVGGGALNALRNAIQFGVNGAMLSMRGGDAAGALVAETIDQAGIEDLSVTFLDRGTPSYTAILDRDGELVAGFADMGLYDAAFPRQLRRTAARDAIAAADAVLCDANVPADGLLRVTELTAGQPVFVIGVSPAKVIRLKDVLPRLTCAFLNRKEALALASAAGRPIDELGADIIGPLRAAGLRAAVITSGAEPLIAYDKNGAYRLAPPAPREVIDVTGTGDALTGATIAAMMRSATFPEALRHGVAASIMAIESPAAVPVLSKRAFDQVLALVPEPDEMA